MGDLHTLMRFGAISFRSKFNCRRAAVRLPRAICSLIRVPLTAEHLLVRQRHTDFQIEAVPANSCRTDSPTKSKRLVSARTAAITSHLRVLGVILKLPN